MDLQEVGWEAWTGLIWISTGMVAGTCKCNNKHLGSLKCG